MSTSKSWRCSFSLFLLVAGGSSSTAPQADCVFEGFWRASGSGRDFLLKLEKGADKWTATVAEGHDIGYPQDAPISWEKPPCLFFCSLRSRDPAWEKPPCRNDTAAPSLGPLRSYFSTERHTFWLGRLSSDSFDSITWTTQGSVKQHHPLCPLASLDRLAGQWQIKVHSGGCNDNTFERVRFEDAPLTEAGYRKVASYPFVFPMKDFIRQVISSKGWSVKDETGLSGFAPWYSTKAHQSLAQMEEELASAAWVDHGRAAEGDVSDITVTRPEASVAIVSEASLTSTQTHSRNITSNTGNVNHAHEVSGAGQCSRVHAVAIAVGAAIACLGLMPLTV